MRVKIEAISLLFGVTIIALLFVRQAAHFSYDPAIVNALAPAPRSTHDGLDLYEGRRIRQTFLLSSSRLSHVAVGIRNFQGASPKAIVRVQLFDKHEQALWTGFSEIGQTRMDDVTLLPAPLRLRANQPYSVEVTAIGVSPSQALTLFYDKASTGFGGGQASANGQPLPGNMRLQILYYPTIALL